MRSRAAALPSAWSSGARGSSAWLYVPTIQSVLVKRLDDGVEDIVEAEHAREVVQLLNAFRSSDGSFMWC